MNHHSWADIGLPCNQIIYACKECETCSHNGGIVHVLDRDWLYHWEAKYDHKHDDVSRAQTVDYDSNGVVHLKPSWLDALGARSKSSTDQEG